MPYDVPGYAIELLLLHMLQLQRLFIGPRCEGDGWGPRYTMFPTAYHSVLPNLQMSQVMKCRSRIAQAVPRFILVRYLRTSYHTKQTSWESILSCQVLPTQEWYPNKNLTMSFNTNSQDVRIEDGHILKARVQNEGGDFVDSEINLNDFLGNDDGKIPTIAFYGFLVNPRWLSTLGLTCT